MGAMRSLNWLQRKKLTCLTARSGSVANLEVLLAWGDNVDAHVVSVEVLEAAANAGQLEVCRWLRLQSCPYGYYVLGEAAKGGHQAVYEWLLADGCSDGTLAAGLAAIEAAGGGHVGLMDWLLGSAPISGIPGLLQGAAAGVDLPTLQRVHHAYLGGSGEGLGREERFVLAAAAASPTADWCAKVEWLEGQGCSRTADTCARAAGLPDGRARLEWLRLRGYPLSAEVVVEAARGGNVDALQYVLAEGVQVDARSAQRAASGAALDGHLAVLQALLHAPGFGIPALRSADAALNAAHNGHMPVVVWLAEVRGAAKVLTVEVAESAASSGSMELLAWLHAQGCPWGASVLAAAARGGSEEQLEWLVAHGCPMGEDGKPYQRGLDYGDLPMLRCLRRLGCPWGPCGRTFTRAIGTYNRERSGNRPPAASLRTVRWLLEEGCPVDWDRAMREARRGWKSSESRIGGAEAVAADDPSRTWLPELVQHFAGCLTCNEVACVLRLINKAAAAQFSRPQDRIVRLSLPVPHRAFVWRWSGMRAMRSLNRSQRTQLTCLTARSGSIANLEVLLAGANKRTIMEGPVLTSAAAAGQLEVCRWLRLQGCPYGMYGYDALGAAVKDGHQAVYEWLLAADSCPAHSDAALATGWAAIQAAGSGQVGLMDWLLGSARIPHVPGLLEGAAVGVDLPTLQRLHQTYACGSGEGLGREERLDVLAAAAASPTADWRAKVEWLEGQGCARTADTCVRAAELPDGQARLEWLRQRGYPLSAEVVVEAARGGNVDALQYVLAEGVQVDARSAQRAASGAALDGHLAVLQALLHAPGFGIPALRSADAALNAAHNGHMPVVVWLAEVLGAAKVLTVEVAECAASSGSMELLTWLHAHGCPWCASVFAAAAGGGSEEQLEWLEAYGCPMGEDGEPYQHALANADLPVLRCLRRLGCPWGPCGRTFTRAIGTYNRERSGNRQPAASLRTLGWLLEEGCPVDWDEAMREARRDPALQTCAPACMKRQQEGERQGTWPPTEPLEEPEAAAPQPQQQLGCAEAVDADDPSRIWLPELVQRFAGRLAPNEVACILRLVNKATTTQFSRPQDRIVRLSLPVPHRAFVWRWSGMRAMRSLNRLQCRQLPCLTARSGSIANLEVLLAGDNEGVTLEGPVLTAAAAAGQLEVCRWLRLQGCPYGHDVLGEAAKGGHQAVYEWLLADGCPTHPDGVLAAGLAAVKAASGGHVGLMDWLLLGSASISGIPGLLQGAAAGVDLPTLQRLHHAYLGGPGEGLLRYAEGLDVLAAAAASPTADWHARVEWLEGRGCRRTAGTCARAAGLPDGRARLEWLRQRGYPLSAEVAVEAASGGNVDALQYVLAEGVQDDARSALCAAAGAAVGGHLAVLQALLHAPGFGIPALRSADEAAPAAAMNGHMPVVVWLADVLGAAEVLTVEVPERAAGSGSMELLAWLHAHGCPWDASVFAAATGGGSEEQLEWLVAHGCPMGEDGEPYQRALANADLPMVRCLRRLGCPWNPCGRTFTSAVRVCNRDWKYRQLAAVLRTLRWLLEEGCPVNWDGAIREAWWDPALQAWLEEQREPRG
ncbi:Ankyrin repeat domain-containing protein [Tetrabaena socialis]|uniref:Ankyrin repeat domain-containing protein n=1 Tax=Tetrabaena socialis TaxID=47790 RepID=A0A2J8A6U9_9CHLO|nr:Ankyrin repeat domain-containing protein [Tetrabaena socialis]|eukprot:PNH08244.1 Ankyrin repeat domain-containing protein [Tetrabaena socialis]